MKFRLLRLVVPTAAMSLLLLLLGGVAAWYLHGLQRNSSRLLVDSVARVEAAEELAIISHELRYQLARYQTKQDSANLFEANELRDAADDWLGKAVSLASSNREKQLIEKIHHGYHRLFETFDVVVQGRPTELPPGESLDRLHDVAIEEILAPSDELRRLSRRSMFHASQRNQSIADRMGITLLLLGSCGAAAGLLAGFGLARGIHRSLAQLTVPVRDATGRLNEVVGPLTVSADESFGELEFSLQTLADQVGEVVRRLQESQLAALRSQQLAAMGQLAAGLAHELRNPLTSMKMLVQPGEGDEETVDLDEADFAVLREEIDRLEHTIQVFLDYARPPKLEKRPVMLREVIEQTVDFVSRRARQLGIRFEEEIPRRIVFVDADAGQVRQVLLNLLLNAMEASGPGDAISIRLACEPDGSCDEGSRSTVGAPEWMRIEIGDRGPGLPAAVGERIFDPFESTKEAGTGLGLTVCKRIVEDHKGEIIARNRDGGGALFLVRLPTISSEETTRLSPDQAEPPRGPGISEA